MVNNDNPFADLQENNTESLPPPTYSYGSDPAILKILELSDVESIDTIAINLLTLMRNVYDKNKTIDENLDLLIDNILNLKTNISNHYYKQEIVNPVLYFYLFNYDEIVPKEYMRSSETESKRSLDKFKNRFIEYYKSTFKTNFHLESFTNILVVYEVETSPLFKSFQQIRSSISSFANRHIVALHTHLPIDAHVLQYFKSFIVRSYQGDFYDYKTYGHKVFNVNVPFIDSTHIVFGDKELIKGTVQRKQKKELIAKIESEEWHLWTKSKISDKLKDMGVVPYKL